MNDILHTQESLALCIDQVRQRFIGRAHGQLQELDILLDRVEKNPEDSVSWAAITSIVHKISGVAATLGFDEVGRLACASEECLTNVGVPHTPDATAQILGYVDELVEALDKIVVAPQSPGAFREPTQSV